MPRRKRDTLPVEREVLGETMLEVEIAREDGVENMVAFLRFVADLLEHRGKVTLSAKG